VSSLPDDGALRTAVPGAGGGEVRERLAKLGAEPMPMTPERFDAYVREEIAANEKIIRAAGVKGN